MRPIFLNLLRLRVVWQIRLFLLIKEVMMKCKVKRRIPLWGIVLSLPLWSGSCVDGKYDLDRDIDMTINVGGEHLTLPAGSTDTAFLSKIIEVEEGDMMQPDPVTRVYHLTKKDDIDVKPTTVDVVTIQATTTDMSQELNTTADAGGSSATTNLDQNNELEAKAENIDEALKELGEISTDNPAELTVTFNVESAGGMSCDEVKAGELTVLFPDFLVFAEGEVEAGNRFVLKNEVLYQNSRPYTKTFHVTGYRFSEAAGEGEKPDENRNLTVKGDVQMTGDVTTSGISGSGSLTLKLDVNLAAMDANRVRGVIQPEIEAEATKIELNDLPDFLKDEETRMDITNPVIALIAKNPMETDVEVDAELTPMKGGAAIEGHKVEVGSGNKKAPIVLKPGDNVIALSRLGESTVEGATDQVKVDDMNNLLEIIPDFINVDLKPVVRNEDYYWADLGTSYKMPSSYDVDVPLSFEQNLNIVYSDSVADLNKDLNDLDQVMVRKAHIILSVDNALPLKLQLTPENVRIKDVYGRELPGIVKEIAEDKQYIAESADGEKPSTSEVVLVVTSEDDRFLSKIDRLCFKIKGVPGTATGVPLKDTQWLRITDIKLAVPGGVNVDLN